MGTRDDNVNARANQSADRAKNYSPSVQYAIVQVLPNLTNGSFWGFTDVKDIQKHISAIQTEPNLTARKLGNACLLEVSPKFILSAVQAIDPNALTNEDLNNIQKKMAEATVEFEKFLISRGKKGFSGMIGIYCTNNVTAIKYKGTNYPAFRLPMSQALEIMNMYGYQIQVGQSFMSAQQASGAGQALWDSTQLSPTKTGILINIKSTYSPEQMAQCEKQFKMKYNIK